MHINPSPQEAMGAICVRFFQDNTRLRERLGNNPDAFRDFVRDALRLAEEDSDRIFTPEFRARWQLKSLPAKSK